MQALETQSYTVSANLDGIGGHRAEPKNPEAQSQIQDYCSLLWYVDKEMKGVDTHGQ